MLSLSSGSRVVGAALLVAACEGSPSGETIASTRSGIVGGKASPATQDAVVFLLRNTAAAGACSATAIAPNLLVTARHCVSNERAGGGVDDVPADELLVFTGANARGEYNRAVAEANEGLAAARGVSVVFPPSTTLYPDIAFVVLDRPLDVPVAAIRVVGRARVGERLDVVGYGVDETGARPEQRMQRAGVVVGGVGPGPLALGADVASGEFVVGESACNGDSGGPALSEVTHALVGVSSRVYSKSGAGRCTGEVANVYTSLSPWSSTVTDAFRLAGATPTIEEGSPESPTADERSSAEPARLASEPHATTGEDAPASPRAGGCHASSQAHSRTPATVALSAIAAAFLAVRTRRNRNEGNGRARRA